MKQIIYKTAIKFVLKKIVLALIKPKRIAVLRIYQTEIGLETCTEARAGAKGLRVILPTTWDVH